MSWKAVEPPEYPSNVPSENGSKAYYGDGRHSRPRLPLRRRFAATPVSELLGCTGKADSLAEREEFGPGPESSSEDHRPYRGGPRGFEYRFLQRRI
jgi:hypothetical protein